MFKNIYYYYIKKLPYNLVSLNNTLKKKNLILSVDQESEYRLTESSAEEFKKGCSIKVLASTGVSQKAWMGKM